MLSVGVPRTAVAQKMKDDNVVRTNVPSWPVKSIPRVRLYESDTPRRRSAPPPRTAPRLHERAGPTSAGPCKCGTFGITLRQKFAGLRAPQVGSASARPSQPPQQCRFYAVVEENSPQRQFGRRRAMNVGIMLGKLVGSGERASSRRQGGAHGRRLSIDQLELIIAIADGRGAGGSSSVLRSL